MKLIRSLIFIILIPIPSSLAEYRAYELVIENPENGSLRKVVTTLDPSQYPSYYPVKQDEKISLARSWMCWGASDYHQDICPAPDKTDKERIPASN
jgi:hypothetical protein